MQHIKSVRIKTTNSVKDVHPPLKVSLFDRQINSFQFFGVIGYSLGLAVGIFVASVNYLNPFVVLLMALVGAITFFVLTFVSKIITGREVIVYYHHEIGILFLCTLTLFFLHLPILPYLDITLVGIGVFLSFGRLGCYSVGCCHGRPFKKGIVYGREHVKAGFTWYYQDVTLFPIQLVESLYVGVIVIVGLLLILKSAAPGTFLILYTVVYGFMRFILEFFRGDPERPMWLGVTEAQWTTLLLTAISLVLAYVGVLPFYKWHIVEMILMAILSVAVITTFKHKGSFAFFTSPHIKQLADALVSLEKLQASMGSAKHEVTTYVSKMGVCISYGNNEMNDGLRSYYTISSINGNKLNLISARKLGVLIAHLRMRSSEFYLVEKNNGIYHIIFSKKKSQTNEIAS